MPECHIRNITAHHFHFNGGKDNTEIGYDMIIWLDSIVQLRLVSGFKRKVLGWDNYIVHMKYPVNFLDKSNLAKLELQEERVQTKVTVSTIETTARVVNTLYSIYKRDNLYMVASRTNHLNTNKRKLWLGLLNEFEDLFDVTLDKQDTKPA